MSDKKVLIITQARMSSTRLPGKIMKEVSGKTMLEYHVRRLSRIPAKLAVATSTQPSDDVVESWCRMHDIAVYRGDELDVLDRFYNTLKEYGGDIIVRVTSDCPFIDSALIIKGLDMYREANNDRCYVSNCFPRTFARGFDFEIFSAAMLNEAHSNATDAGDREHVTPYFWKNRDGAFDIRNLAQDENHAALRITLDEEEDFTLIKTLLEDHNATALDHRQLEELLLSHPELRAINAHIEQKKV
jgi:spore coat polysaccharide biosynthesis protein SpsF